MLSQQSQAPMQSNFGHAYMHHSCAHPPHTKAPPSPLPPTTHTHTSTCCKQRKAGTENNKWAIKTEQGVTRLMRGGHTGDSNLLDYGAGIHGAGVVLLWVILHTFVWHIVGLPDLSSLHIPCWWAMLMRAWHVCGVLMMQAACQKRLVQKCHTSQRRTIQQECK